ncbi:MAG: hypothetical protein ACREA1_01650 [Nitrosotalea sp.]
MSPSTSVSALDARMMALRIASMLPPPLRSRGWTGSNLTSVAAADL